MKSFNWTSIWLPLLIAASVDGKEGGLADEVAREFDRLDRWLVKHVPTDDLAANTACMLEKIGRINPIFGSRLKRPLQIFTGLMDAKTCTAETIEYMRYVGLGTNAHLEQAERRVDRLVRPLMLRAIRLCSGYHDKILHEVHEFIRTEGRGGDRAQEVGRNVLIILDDGIIDEIRGGANFKLNFVESSCCMKVGQKRLSSRVIEALYFLGHYESLDRFYSTKQRKIRQAYIKEVLEPCEQYERQMEWVFDTGRIVSTMYNNRLDDNGAEFLASRSKEYQDDLIRFGLCKTIIREGTSHIDRSESLLT